MIVNESAESYYKDFISKLDSIDSEYNKSANFYSGSKNYRVTSHGTGKFTIIGTKGYDRVADNYLRKMDSNYEYFSRSQVVGFLKMLATSLWNKKGEK